MNSFVRSALCEEGFLLKKSRWGLKHPQRLVFYTIVSGIIYRPSITRYRFQSTMNHPLPEQTLGCIATDYGSSPSPDRSPGPAHYYWTGHSTANIRYQVAAVSHLLHSAHAGPGSSSQPALPSRQDRLSLPHERPEASRRHKPVAMEYLLY